MRFDHVGVIVRDLEAAKAFAADVLGLGAPVREFEAPDFGLAGAFYDVGGATVEVFTVADDPDGRLVEGEDATVDHFAVRVADLEAERARLAGHGVTFRGPSRPGEVAEPIEMRGTRHLWTDKASSGGYMIQLIEDPTLAEG
jgi:catechol 2,3-dioxygenase-like lactoylglutathione lyase family enzyme